MAATAFSLIGMISLKGVEDVTKHLTKMDKQIRKVQREMGKFGKGLENTGKKLTQAFTAPILAVGAGFTLLAVKTGKYADQLLDLNQITGLSLGTLQELEHVSRVAGVSFEGLTGTISKLSNQIPEIVKGTGSAAEALIALGVTVTDSSGNIKDMDTLFPELLNSLRGVENVTQRNALAQDIFGRSLQDIAPVLGMTADEFDTVRKEAHAMGMVLSGSAINSANDFRVASEKLQAQFGALGRSVAITFMPVLTDVMIPVLKNKVLPALLKVGGMLKKVGDWFKNLSAPMQKTIMMWGVLLVAVGPVVMIMGKLIIAAKGLVPLIKLLTFSQGALNAVMAANPIGIVIVAIVALIAAGIALYNNWSKVSSFLKLSWQSFVDLVVVSVSHLKELFYNALTAYLSLAESMTTFLPFLGEKVTSLKKKFQALADKEKISRAERNKAAQDTVIATEVLAEYDVAVTQVTEDIGVLGAQEVLMAAQRIELEQAWSDKYTELTQSRAEALIAEKTVAIEEAERLGAETDTIEAFYAEKEKQRMQELTDARTEFEQQWTDKVTALSATRLEQLTKEKEEAIANAAEVGADTTAIKQFYQIESIKIEKEKQDAVKKFEQERTAEYTEYLQDKKSKDLQASLETLTNEEEWNDAHAQLIEMRKEEIEKEREHAITTAKDMGAEKEDIDKLYNEKLITLSKASYNKRKRYEEKLLKKKVRTWEKGLSSFADIAGQIGDLVHEYYDTEIALQNDKMKKQIKGIKNSKLSEKDKAKAIQGLEKKTYEKVKAIKIKQAKQDKKMAIFNVIIATALAIMKVAASAPGFFIRIAAIAAIAALGIVQIALIKRRPLPSFAKGGGVKGNRGGIEAQVGEGKETELIFPLKTGVNMLLDTLMSKLNSFGGTIPAVSPVPMAAGGSMHLHVGTLIADKAGIKKLERAMRKYRIQENQRRGFAQ